MRIFHFLFSKKQEIRDTYRSRAVEIGVKNFSKATKFVDEERDILNERNALHSYAEEAFTTLGFDESATSFFTESHARELPLVPSTELSDADDDISDPDDDISDPDDDFSDPDADYY